MLVVEELTKSFQTSHGTGTVHALRSVSFRIAEGDFFALLGPSGSGKSTVLQCIAGLETPDSGAISIGGRVVYASRDGTFVRANQRGLGMVFQSYAIWPHMSVFDNVAFPLSHGSARHPREDVRRLVGEALELVKLSEYADRPAPHLSGGQQQRVALARAIVGRPRLLLLDEPLSNLDAKLRDAMRTELRQLIKSLGITTVFVTHDQVEAMGMADHIALMREGRIEQLGTPREIYQKPRHAFVASFMGSSNLVPGIVGVRRNGLTAFRTDFGILFCGPEPALDEGKAGQLVVRPHAVILHAAGRAPSAPNVVPGRVTGTSLLGERVEVDVMAGERALKVIVNSYEALPEGDDILMEIPPERCVIVVGDAEQAEAGAAPR